MAEALSDADPLDDIVPWCTHYADDADTRTDACLNGLSPLVATFSIGEKVIGTATFAMGQEILLFNNAPEIDQYLVLVPMEIAPTLGAVTLQLDRPCRDPHGKL